MCANVIFELNVIPELVFELQSVFLISCFSVLIFIETNFPSLYGTFILFVRAHYPEKLRASFDC